MEKIGSQRAVPFLMRAVADSQEEVRKAGIVALGTIGAKDALNPLIEIYPDQRKDEKLLIISALGNLRDPRATDFLLNLLEERRPRWKKILGEGKEETLPTLFRALGRIGDKRAVSKIEDFISQTGDERLLKAAKGALAMIHGATKGVR